MFTIMCLVIYGIVMTVLLAKSNRSTKKWIEKHQYAAKERDMTNDRAEALSSRLTAAEATLSSVVTLCEDFCRDPGQKPGRYGSTPTLALLAIKTTLVEQNTTIKSLLAGIASNLERTGGYDMGATIESQINALGDRWEAERSERLNSEEELITFRALSAHSANAGCEKGTALQQVTWMVEECVRLRKQVLDLKEREDYYEYQSENHYSAMSELQSNLETWKNLANTYLLSRNQAREDIQSMKLMAVATRLVNNQEQLDAFCTAQGFPCPPAVRDAQTFDQLSAIAKDMGLLAITDAIKGDPLDERLATPPKPRNRRGRRAGG